MTEPAAQKADVVVIGGGPSGLFAALTTARAGRRTVLLEAGGDMAQSLCPRVVARLKGRNVRDAEKFRIQCARCDCLTGLGGAAFHFDTDLGYINALTRSKIEASATGEVRTYSGLERALGSFERAQGLVAECYETLYGLGLPPVETDAGTDAPSETDAGTDADADTDGGHGTGLNGDGSFQHVDTAPSQSVTVDDALVVIDNAVRELEEAGSSVLLRHTAVDVRTLPDGGFAVDAETPRGRAEFTADSVVVAVGKLGLPWVRAVAGRLGVRHRPSRRVDVGVRLETRREALAPLLDGCHNPKLSFLNEEGHSVRTFCVCEGGRVMQYGFLGAVALDGQHCLTQPTGKSNLGVVVSVDLPEGEDGTDYARQFAARVAEFGEGRPVVCTLGELAGGPPPEGPPRTSLIDYRHGDLRECLPASVVRDVQEMARRLNSLHEGLVTDDATIAAPVVERLFPDLELSEDMESSVPGLYFVGDSSSKIIGITYGAATGTAAARSILARHAEGTVGGRV